MFPPEIIAKKIKEVAFNLNPVGMLADRSEADPALSRRRTHGLSHQFFPRQ
jgi:hypothetical protein